MVKGLTGNKRVIVAVSRGGLYGPGTPVAAFEHVESYLRAVFGFIGVKDLEIVVAEGLAMGPQKHTEAMQGALHSVSQLAVHNCGPPETNFNRGDVS